MTDEDKQAARLAIGHRIKELRTEKGLGTLNLAILAGVSPSNVINIEKGRYSVGLDVLNRIATALGARIELVKV